MWKTCSFLTESFRSVLAATTYTANDGAACLNWKKRKFVVADEELNEKGSTVNSMTNSKAPMQQYIRECPSFEVIMTDLSEATALPHEV